MIPKFVELSALTEYRIIHRSRMARTNRNSGVGEKAHRRETMGMLEKYSDRGMERIVLEHKYLEDSAIQGPYGQLWKNGRR